VKALNIEQQEQQLTSVDGNHAANKSNGDVGILKIINQVCSYLPHNIQHHFPSVYHLELKNNELQEIKAENMRNFPNLKHLYIRNNLIAELPENLFINNKKLQFINLNDNKIKVIAANVFDDLPELISVSIERNVCIDSSTYGEIDTFKSEIVEKCST
jgi:Leucine-rich repeat (LRR) protein